MYTAVTRPPSGTPMGELFERLKKGSSYGLIFAGVYASYAIGLYFFQGAEPFARNGTTLGDTIASYAAAGIVAGGIVGALQPLTRSWIGSVLVYSIAGFFVFASIGTAAGGLMNVDWIGCVVLGVVFGVIGSLMWRKLLS